MKRLNKVENFAKGDLIKVIETAPIWNGEKKILENHIFESIFRINRVNAKTYSCTYTEGYMSGSGFKWVKGYDLTLNKKKEYYLI